MTGKTIAADVLLGIAVLIVAGSALGIMIMPDAYRKLHYVTPAAILAPVLVALAVAVEMGVYQNTGETFLALFFLMVAGPYLSHATIRALRVRECGDWRPGKSQK